MTIKTKYKIGEQVYIMFNNRPTEATVKYIRILLGDRGPAIDYSLDAREFRGLNSLEKEFDERRLFKSKDDLVGAL